MCPHLRENPSHLARILSAVVYGFDFERILRPVIRCFGIWMFIRGYDAVKPYSATAGSESLPIAPNVLLRCIQNRASHSIIEDLTEVSQELRSAFDVDPLVTNIGQHWIVYQRCHVVTVIFRAG